MTQPPYELDHQIGFLLRRATQRHLAVFATNLSDLTPTQFAAISKLAQLGATSQNQLGRETAMDAATIKGVIDRLVARGLVETGIDSKDKRRLKVELSEKGQALWQSLEQTGHEISRQTLAPLSAVERLMALELLKKLA